MFRTSFTVQQSTLIKSSDQRKLRAEVSARYSDLTESELDSLFPKNIQTVTQKLSNGVNIFSRADQSAEPVLFELVENNNNGNAKNAGKSPIKRSLVPTVHSAWRCPQMLPAVIVRNPVVEFICRAANVMLPGTLRESPAFIGPKVCKKGALVFVLAQGNPFPVAVGELMIDFAHFASNGMHGPCVRVLHYFSDQLGIVADVPMPEGFAIVPTPSVMPLVSQVVQDLAAVRLEPETAVNEAAEAAPVNDAPTESVPDPSQSDNEMSDSDDEASGSVVAAKAAPIDTSELDRAVQMWALLAFKASITDAMLPMVASSAWADHVLMFKPDDVEFDWRLTSYKKLSKLLNVFVKRRVIKVKDVRGTLQLVEIDRMSEDLVWFVPQRDQMHTRDVNIAQRDKAREQQTKKAEQNAFGDKLVLLESYRPPAHFALIFGDCEPDQMYSMADARQVFTEYLRKSDLQCAHDKSMLAVNDVLRATVLKDALKRGTLKSCPDVLSKKQANELFSASMVKYYAICSEDDAYPRWHSGPPPTVQIVVERRQGKKLVTLVSMLHKFGIDVQAFAHEAQFKFAASTTVQGEGHLQHVLIQGNVGIAVGDILKQLGVPLKCIQIQDKSGK